MSPPRPPRRAGRTVVLLSLLALGCAEDFDPRPDDFDGYWTVAEPFAYVGRDSFGEPYYWDPGSGGTAHLETTYVQGRFTWRASSEDFPCVYHGDVEGAMMVFDRGQPCSEPYDDDTTFTSTILDTTAELHPDDVLVLQTRDEWDWENGNPAVVEAEVVFRRTDDPHAELHW